jgi:hypothetical protein
VHKINAKYNKERVKNGKVFSEKLNPSILHAQVAERGIVNRSKEFF